MSTPDDRSIKAGSKQRQTSKAYRNNYDRIFRSIPTRLILESTRVCHDQVINDAKQSRYADQPEDFLPDDIYVRGQR